MADYCHCPTQAEHDDRIASVLATYGLSVGDLKLIADAREFLRLYFRYRHKGGEAPGEILPTYVLERVERWAS